MIKEEFECDAEFIDNESSKKLDIAAENLKNALHIVIQQLNLKYNKRVKFNLELMAERAVDKFYESYSPNMYSRQEGLYKGAKVTADDSTWRLDTGSEFMTTSYGDAGKEYVFWNSFQKGFHGGAVDGPEHPEPGVPWWKAYGEWLRPAASGPSPEDLIADEDPSGYIIEQQQQYMEDFDRLLQPYIDKFAEILASME